MRPFYILIGALVVIALLVLVFIAIFKPGQNRTTILTPAVVLADHAGDSNVSVSFEINGTTRGNEMHNSIRITVTKNSRMLETLQGYDGVITLSQSFTNTENSFRAFLAGLQTVGFIKESKTAVSEDYLGQCPLGYRYIYRTIGIKDVPKQLWSTNCSNTSGSFRGSRSSVMQLFQNQIPNYSQLVSGVRL